jgi:hypothetical protein
LPKIVREIPVQAERIFVVRSVDDGIRGRRDGEHVLEQLRILEHETGDLEQNALDLRVLSHIAHLSHGSSLTRITISSQ